MADPHHVERLDRFDRATVVLYRLGVGLSAVALGGLAALHARGADDAAARVALVAGVALIGAHLHLYDKVVRWVIVAAGWLGAVLVLAGVASGNGWVGDAGLGFLFVTLSGVALKEQYCFRTPLMRLVPWALAISLVPMRIGLGPPTAAFVAAGAALVGVLAVAKARMPLHYDIGDKSRYQV